MSILDKAYALLCSGLIPPESVYGIFKEPHQEAAFRAATYLLSQGSELPLSGPDLYTIAQTKYGGIRETEDFIDQSLRASISPAVLESVQNQLLLKTVVQQATDQLGSGEYDLASLRKLLEPTVGVDLPVYNIQDIDLPEKEDWLVVPDYPEDFLKLFGGFGAELIYVAGRIKSGKSSFMANLIRATGRYMTLFATVADYGRKDFKSILHKVDPVILKRSNLFIADFNDRKTRLSDIEQCIKKVSPELVIMDRSEKLVRRSTGTKGAESGLGDLADSMRRLAQRYKVPVITDAQIRDLSDWQQTREYMTQEDKRIRPHHMANDRTERAAVLDLFFGLYRDTDNSVWVNVEGRRQGYGLPGMVQITADRNACYTGVVKHGEKNIW